MGEIWVTLIYLVVKQVEGTRGRSGQVTNFNFPRGHMYQQHIGHAI